MTITRAHGLHCSHEKQEIYQNLLLALNKKKIIITPFQKSLSFKQKISTFHTKMLGPNLNEFVNLEISKFPQYVLLLFRYYLPALENGVARSLNKLDLFLSYDVLCCVWLSSGKGDFKKSSNLFSLYLIISPRKRARSFI